MYPSKSLPSGVSPKDWLGGMRQAEEYNGEDNSQVAHWPSTHRRGRACQPNDAPTRTLLPDILEHRHHALFQRRDIPTQIRRSVGDIAQGRGLTYGNPEPAPAGPPRPRHRWF